MYSKRPGVDNKRQNLGSTSNQLIILNTMVRLVLAIYALSPVFNAPVEEPEPTTTKPFKV